MSASFDQGIIAAFDGAGTTHYTDIRGVVRTATAVTTSYQVGQAVNYVGRASRALLVVHPVFAGGGATQYTVYAQILRVDTANPIWNPQSIQTARADGAGAAVEQAIDATDIADIGGGAVDIALITTSAALSGAFQVWIKADHAPVAGDRCFVSLVAG